MENVLENSLRIKLKLKLFSFHLLNLRLALWKTPSGQIAGLKSKNIKQVPASLLAVHSNWLRNFGFFLSASSSNFLRF